MPLTGVWERLAADAATAHRRLSELTSNPPPGELGELLTRAAAVAAAADDRVRRDAVSGSAASPATGLDVPHATESRQLYDDIATRVGRLRNLAYRASLLTVPTAPGEHRFLVSGLRRAVVDLEFIGDGRRPM
jgi:hypothetical protein